MDGINKNLLLRGTRRPAQKMLEKPRIKEWSLPSHCCCLKEVDGVKRTEDFTENVEKKHKVVELDEDEMPS